MKPDLKKYLSVALVFVLVSVLATLGHVAVPMLPPALQAPALGAIGAVLHWVNTLGHNERVMAAVDNAFHAGLDAARVVPQGTLGSEQALNASTKSCSGATANGCGKVAQQDPLPPDTAA